MPRPTVHARTEAFNDLQRLTRERGEHADCSVKAIALACGVSYEQAHAALAAAGRVNGKPTHLEHSSAAIAALGCELAELNAVQRWNRFIARYPKAHQVLKDLTSHHPDRFRSVWADGKTYILYNNHHMWCVVNGVNHDWTRGRALRVTGMWEITRKEVA